jgi:DNA primase
MISKATIEEVKNRIDIVDVVADFVTLKRSGQNYKALSPFTDEKTPSFYVVPAKGIFKDFSSGKGGDAITFVMEHEGMSYLEAIRYLAKKYGVEVKEEARTAEESLAQSERDSLFIVMNFAKDYFKETLHKHEEGRSIGLSYFRERGFHDRTLEKFELGYTLNDWHHLEKKAIAAGYSLPVLEKAGLVIKKEDGKTYDRFRGRVIFPVHNLSGKIIAFGARILTKEKDQPKYINSPETDIYHKSQVLFGLFQGRHDIRKHDFCYLVEGYTDVISLHQAGVENVVASSGTALTEEQIRLIRRFTENVTVLFDGDAAGIKAALRGIDLVLKGGLNVRVVLLPDGEDPDSYSRKMGSSEFQQYLKAHTKDFISFKIDLYSSEASGDPIKKAEAIRELVTSISLIPDAIKRSVYIKETSDLLGIQESVLLTELNKILIQERRKREQERTRDDHQAITLLPAEEVQPHLPIDNGTVVQLQERETIRLLLNYAENKVEEDAGQTRTLREFQMEELDDVELTHPVYREIFNAFKRGPKAGERIDNFYFLENGTAQVKQVVAELSTPRYETSPHWSDKYHIYFPHEKDVIHDVALTNVLRLKYWTLKKMSDDNLAALKNEKDERKQDMYLQIQAGLKNAEKEVANQLGIVIAR